MEVGSRGTRGQSGGWGEADRGGGREEWVGVRMEGGRGSGPLWT